MFKKISFLLFLFMWMGNVYSQTTPHHDFPTTQPTTLKAGINTNAGPIKWFHIHEPNVPGDASMMFSTGSDGVFANYSYIAFTSDSSLALYTSIKAQSPADYGNLVIQASNKAEDIILTTRNDIGCIRFATTDSAQTTDTERMTITRDGKVGIGVTDPQEELVVNGNICAKEITVSLTGEPCWSDYVFDEDYELMTIENLEKTIKKNGHLPEMPNEEEVKNSGVQVGEMQRLLLKKIEELHLYVIQLKKENEYIKLKLEQMHERMEK